MRPLALLLVVALASVAGFAPAPFPKSHRNRDDRASVYGNWEFVVWEMNGRKSTASQYLELTAEKVHFVSIQGGGKVTYKFVTRPEMSPRGFQWTPDGGGGWIGSYRVDGDKLTMIFKSGSDWATRPTDFAATHEYRFVLQRKR